MISNSDLGDLEQFVEDGRTDAGVILTPRSRNDSAIALAYWARLQTLDTFDAAQIRDFVETNRGHSPKCYIAGGQKGTSIASESLHDGLAHNQSQNKPFGSVMPGPVDDPDLRRTRMDTQPGAPPFTAAHTTTAVDYSDFDGNPPPLDQLRLEMLTGRKIMLARPITLDDDEGGPSIFR